MITARNFSKKYDVSDYYAVNDISFTVNKGEVQVIVGESGSGKTTSLKMLNRLVDPSSGSIDFDGENITNLNTVQLRRNTGYVFQEVGLFPHFIVEENIAVVPNLLGWSKDKIYSRIDEFLGLVELNPDQYRKRMPSELSGGQQLRIAIRTLIDSKERNYGSYNS